MRYSSHIYFFLFFFSAITFGQNADLTEKSEISILTISPGKHLNDAFGHTAIRVKDVNMDYVFNYGVYDFEQPNFYTNFLFGLLKYRLGVNAFKDVVRYYKSQNRSIVEQVLNLSHDEKMSMWSYLKNNSLPENRDYLYDFFYDNCATKIREVLEQSLQKQIVFRQPENFQEKSFRDLLHEKLHWNSWSRLGIDLVLGSRVDRSIDLEEHLFLPEYVQRLYALSSIANGKKLINWENAIYIAENEKKRQSFLMNPLFLLSILIVLIFGLTYRDYKNTKESKWLDILLFSVTGIVGVILLFLWFGTAHLATRMNLNVLWAFAPHLFFSFFLLKRNRPRWMIGYLKVSVLFIFLSGTLSLIGLQSIPFTIMIFMVAFSWRQIYLINRWSLNRSGLLLLPFHE